MTKLAYLSAATLLSVLSMSCLLRANFTIYQRRNDMFAVLKVWLESRTASIHLYFQAWTPSSHFLGQRSLDGIQCGQLILQKLVQLVPADVRFKDKMHQISPLMELKALHHSF